MFLSNKLNFKRMKLFSLLSFLFLVIACGPEINQPLLISSFQESESNSKENVSETDLIPCGGSFDSFIGKLKEQFYGKGYDPFLVQDFLKKAKYDPEVIRRDRSQGIFKKTFIEFSKLVMTEHRILKGEQFAREHADTLSLVYQEYGVPPSVLLSFLALETDYGIVQGDFNTLNSLLTLSYDCRRPELFQPHVFSAFQLFQLGSFNPDLTKGAWAGEIGMIQMLPTDIILYGVDQDGDGKINLKSSVPDALMTAGNTLNKLGWEPYQPWLVEVRVPENLNWLETGLKHFKSLKEWQTLGVKIRDGQWPQENLKASLLLPHGRKGPAFFAFPNYEIYLEWNQSSIYSTTSAFFATLLAGKPMYNEGNPSPPLSDEEIKRLQMALIKRGHDVGGVDGILGRKTKPAIQKEQARLNLPADAWPTKELLDLLE